MYSRTYWGQRFRTFFFAWTNDLKILKENSFISQFFRADASIYATFQTEIASTKLGTNRHSHLLPIPPTMLLLIFYLLIDHCVPIRQALLEFISWAYPWWWSALSTFFENSRFPSGVYKFYFYYDMIMSRRYKYAGMHTWNALMDDCALDNSNIDRVFQYLSSLLLNFSERWHYVSWISLR